LGAFRQRSPSLFTREVVALDTFLEIAKSFQRKPLCGRGLLGSQAMVMLHCLVDRDVFLDLT
jgi:hypothetical protein